VLENTLVREHILTHLSAHHPYGHKENTVVRECAEEHNIKRTHSHTHLGHVAERKGEDKDFSGIGVCTPMVRDLAFSTSFLLDNESPSHLPATLQHWLRVCDHLQGPTPSAEDDNASAQERDDDSVRPLPLSPILPSLFCMNWEAAPGSPQEGERETLHDGVRGVTPGNRAKGGRACKWEEEEDLFVFNDTIEGPRAPAVKPGRITQA